MRQNRLADSQTEAQVAQVTYEMMDRRKYETESQVNQGITQILVEEGRTGPAKIPGTMRPSSSCLCLHVRISWVALNIPLPVPHSREPDGLGLGRRTGISSF